MLIVLTSLFLQNNRDLDFRIKIIFNGELSQMSEENTYRMR
jgi:hypothetical protein